MGMAKARALTLAFVVVALAMGGSAAGCGGATTGGGSATATTSTATASTILGHEPTGLAKTVVDRGAMIVANDSSYPPQSSIDEKTGELVGFDVDVANKVGQLLDLKVEFKHPAWETVPSVLRKGLCDVSIGSMTDTPEGRRQLAFTDPYYYSRAQAFMRKGGTPLTGSQDLAGKKVGVRAATTYYDYLVQDTKANVTMYDTDAEAFAALEAGVVDYVVSSDVAGQQAISSGQQIALSGKPLYYESCVFATKKGESDWLALLNYAIGKMHADGSLAAMSRHWFYGTDLTSKD
jgi:polar amino acid transport system substrate-binding protein